MRLWEVRRLTNARALRVLGATVDRKKRRRRDARGRKRYLDGRRGIAGNAPQLIQLTQIQTSLVNLR